ncbi:MAG: HAMP domain-containing histidine kinase [Glaciimonas sp.]|nr:HAMP domain-containing histidine kinase [Glaciimonas sp.]
MLRSYTDECIRIDSLVADIAKEFEQTNMIQAGILKLSISNVGQSGVWFDPLQYRKVLVNIVKCTALCWRWPWQYSLANHMNPKGGIELFMQDDGQPITSATRSHLFEPFYTISNKGTGLGPFLARELCLNNGAKLDE